MKVLERKTSPNTVIVKKSALHFRLLTSTFSLLFHQLRQVKIVSSLETKQQNGHSKIFLIFSCFVMLSTDSTCHKKLLSFSSTARQLDSHSAGFLVGFWKMYSNDKHHNASENRNGLQNVH
jgi:hypothetical protein